MVLPMTLRPSKLPSITASQKSSRMGLLACSLGSQFHHFQQLHSLLASTSFLTSKLRQELKLFVSIIQSLQQMILANTCSLRIQFTPARDHSFILSLADFQ
ncbi:hypothetical protein D3C84_805630 [compost metagenome]